MTLSLKRHTLTALVSFLVLFIFMPGVAHAAGGAAPIYTIVADATGGSCTSIGAWDSGSKTCTLTTDLTIPGDNDGIQINGYGITLDGNGHVVNGTGGRGYGIFISASGSTLKNLTVRQFGQSVSGGTSGVGVYVGGGDNRIVCNTIASNVGFGIWNNTSGNAYLGNTIDSNGTGIYRPYLGPPGYSGSITISGNTISANGIGISLGISGNVTGNTFKNNVSTGIILWDINSTVQHNYFLGNPVQADDKQGSNTFYFPAPYGGNLWSDYDEPAEGCVDNNSDGFCDSPHAFSGGQDDLPLVSSSAGVASDAYYQPVACEYFSSNVATRTMLPDTGLIMLIPLAVFMALFLGSAMFKISRHVR